MDLFINRNPTLTQHLVARGSLQEAFVVVDVGVLGGENPRWQFLGDHLIVHGFDAGKNAVAELAASKRSGRHYHWVAIGEHDGEGDFYLNVQNPSASSFIPTGPNRFASDSPTYERTRVPIRSLDSLVAGGEIPPPDFLKVDVEGFEIAVFRGAAQCISSRVLGLEFETSMNVGPEYPHTHFGTLQEALLPEGFRLFDIAFDRATRATFQEACRRERRPVPAEGELGRPGTFNVFFCQDVIGETDEHQIHKRSRPRETVDQILKQIIIFELYGLVDVAFDTLCRFSDELQSRIDPELGRRLLLASSGRYAWSPETLTAEITHLGKGRNARLLWCARTLLAATSWAAPIRAIKRLVTGRGLRADRS